MVQLSASFITIATLITASFATPVGKRDVPTVEADLATIKTQVTTLDDAITAFPTSGGTLLEALTIHTDATTLITSLQKATSDTEATPAFSEADGRTILNDIEVIEPTIIDALNQIAEKQSAFAALPIGGIPALILQDLTFLSSNTSAFENALLAKSPSDLLSEADGVVSAINSAFSAAIAAYS